MPAVARCRSLATVDQENTVARTRRSVTSIAAVAVAAAVAMGVGGAIAQQDADPAGVDPAALLERLDVLDGDLPQDIAPTDVTIDAETGIVTLVGDATSVRASIELIETDVRQLFIDADDATGEVADAVALVAQGWLDVWSGSAALGAAESNDLAFPMQATDDLGVEAGADTLRGSMETGLRLVVQGRDRHLEGYGALEELNAAAPETQTRIDERARAARTFDDEIRPRIAAALGDASTSVLVPTERFVTDAPGVRSRATSMTVVCVDREALDAATTAGNAELEDVPVDIEDVLADIEVERDECDTSGSDLFITDGDGADDQ